MAAKLEKVKNNPGIYKRGSRYVITWEHRGRQHKESFRTLLEAREAKGRRHAGERRPTSRIAFEVYFERWIRSYAGRTTRGFSETTRPEYERPIRTHALSRWNGWRLAEVEAVDVRELFAELRAEGCTTSQIKKLRAALSVMFATAVEDGLRSANPIAGVRIPAAPDDGQPVEEKAKALTRAELAKLLAAIPEDWQLLFEFLTHTGMRISECFGLRWEHLDLGDDPKVKVREQFYRGKRRKLKSGAGKRDLPLSPGMTARLLTHRRDHYGGAKAPVFASRVGTELIRGKVAERVLAPAAIGAGFKSEEPVEDKDGKEKTKVRATVTFHAFRHTCASLLLDNGRNIKQVQEWLGHADPGVTLRTFVHLMDEGIGDADFFDVAVAPADASKVEARPDGNAGVEGGKGVAR